MAATILCVGCGQAPTKPFKSVRRWWSARLLVLKNAYGFQQYTNHVLCGTCQQTNLRHSRRSYDMDEGWDERDSRRKAIDEKRTDCLGQLFFGVLSEEERVLLQDCQLAVSDWIVYPPGSPGDRWCARQSMVRQAVQAVWPHSPQCHAIDGAPQASLPQASFTGSANDGQMDVDK